MSVRQTLQAHKDEDKVWTKIPAAQQIQQKVRMLQGQAVQTIPPALSQRTHLQTSKG